MNRSVPVPGVCGAVLPQPLLITRSAGRAVAAAALLLLAGCGGGGGTAVSPAPSPSVPPSAPPSGPLPAPPTPAAWVPVQTTFERAYAATRYGGAALAVYAPDGRLLYSRVRGDFALDRRVAVASASKLVSGVALLRLVDQGLLSLDSTTGAVLGWTGPQAVTGFTPTVAVGLEYGLTAWLECATPAAGCDVLSSAGAFGFMPWIDRAGGYYAIIGMEEVGDPTEFSTRLAVELRPLIRTAIRG